TPLTGVTGGAGAAVAAGAAIDLHRVRARPRGERTGPGNVALVGGGADDGVAARADPALAGVGLRAGIAVVAGTAVGLRRVRARPRGRITGAGSVALVGGGAGDGVAARAHPALAGVGLRAGVAVVAGAAVGLRRVRARPRGGITGAGSVALFGGGAGDGVAARAPSPPRRSSVLAGIAVVAGAAVGLRRVRARPRGGITGAGGVALVGGGAGDGVAAGAHPALAGVGLRAGIAVVAGPAIGLHRARARPRGGITGAG